jgi:endo-1,4-beta-D-glucanase Y
MKSYLSFSFVILLIASHKLSAQVNTPAGATVPFGSRIQANPNPYPYGLIPATLPTGAYNPSSNQYGKSQDAYNAYNSWKTCYVDQTCNSGTRARVKFDNTTQTVSEGIAYGMLLSAYAADKALFDKLWAYYKGNPDANGLMHWCINGCGTATCGTGAATDAELDAAMALIVAECQWPTATSPYDYAAEASWLIAKIRQYEIQPASNPPQYQTNNGDMWGFANTCRNPSYQSPAYYKLFQAYDGGAPAGFWTTNCVSASYTLLTNNRNATTGLVSNWCDQNGTPNSCNGPNEYGYDACRNPWRMATDYIWNGDANALGITSRMANWLRPTAVTNVRGPLAMNAANASLGTWHNATFVSTYALAVMGNDPAGANGPANQTYLNSMYTETVNVTETQNCSATGGSGYFGNTLRVISLFMMTGNFWKPCPSPSPVDLLHFTAEEQSGKVVLKWATTSETNNDYFEILRSSDGEHFTSIGKVKGAGNSNSILFYSTVDHSPLPGINYYRLAQHDADGKINYSDMVSLSYNPSHYIGIMPNPFEDEISIVHSDDVEINTVNIRDLTGKTIKIFHNVKNSLNVSELKEGTYIIEVISNAGTYTRKLIK